MTFRIREFKREELEKKPHELRELPLIIFNHHFVGKKGESIAQDWERRKNIFYKALKNPDYGMLVIEREKDNLIVGFLDYWIIHCPIENANLCFLQNFRIWTHFRKQGLGKALVLALKEIAMARNCKEIHVVSGPDAVGFYKKCGFQVKDVFLEQETKNILKGERLERE